MRKQMAEGRRQKLLLSTDHRNLTSDIRRLKSVVLLFLRGSILTGGFGGAFLFFFGRRFFTAACGFFSGSRGEFFFRVIIGSGSNVETGLAGGVGENLETTVIQKSVPIESDLRDAGFEGFFGDGFTDLSGSFAVSTESDFGLQGLVVRSGGNQRLTLAIIDNLHVDVLVAAEHAKSRPCRIPFDGIGDAERPPFFLEVEFFELFHGTDR